MLSCVQLFATPWTVTHQAPLSMGFSKQEYWSGLSFPSLEDLPGPGIKPTSLVSAALAGMLFTGLSQERRLEHRPSSEYSGLIPFRIDWFDLLAVQGTLKSIIQNHSSKVSILWCSAFLMAQLSHANMTTRKIIALTIQTFVSKEMPLLLRFVIAFLPRSKHLFIS